MTSEPVANAAGFAPDRDDVFGRIAGRYDLLCELFSLGAHRLWKAAMARRIAELPGAAILDLASGTGDIPLRLSRSLGANTSRLVTVTDICPQMLEIAARKLEGAKAVGAIALADAERLDEIDSNAFDVVSIAFGMKICDRRQVAREALRVLRPGGRFLCLEAARIPVAPIHGLYLAYMRLCMPLIAQLATGGDRGAYDYLVRGVHDFPDQRSFAAELSAIGFEAVGYRNLTFGIVALHEARKPAARGSRRR